MHSLARVEMARVIASVGVSRSVGSLAKDGSASERGPYWYFQFHEGGKRKKLYLGKTSDPESTLVTKRTESSGE
jgi:hypothetical protein